MYHVLHLNVGEGIGVGSIITICASESLIILNVEESKVFVVLSLRNWYVCRPHRDWFGFYYFVCTFKKYLRG